MTATPRNTRALTQGAMFAALTAMMALAAVIFPPLGIFFLVLPLPVAIAAASVGLNAGVMSGLVATLLTGLVTRTPDAALHVASSGLIGLAIGHALEQRYPAVKALLFSAAASAVGTLMEYGFTALIIGVPGVRKELLLGYQSMVKMMQQTLGPAVGLTPALIEQLIRAIIPSVVLLGITMSGVLNYFLARMLARRVRVPMGPGFPPFRQWRFPKWMAVLWIVAFIGIRFIPASKGLQSWEAVVLLNTYSLLTMVFLLQGLAVVWYLYDRFGVDGLGRWVLTALAIIIPYAANIISFVGLFDVFLDYRKPREGSK